jgi:chromosomal replication initiator protein
MTMKPKPQPTKSAIFKAVKEAACAVMRVTMAELEGKRRYPRIAWARHVAIYVSRKLSGASHPELSRAFGFADHNSSIYSCQVVLVRLRTAQPDSPFTLDVTDVEKHAKRRLRSHG